MFRTLNSNDIKTVCMTINGRECLAPAGSSVWTAMALAGETTTRLAPVTEQPRSAYCAMGMCFECLMEIDAVPNRRACLTAIRDGMQVYLQTITERPQARHPMVTGEETDDSLARDVSNHDQL